MKNHCQNFIQQYQNITLLKQEFVFICKKGVETKDPEKVKEVKKELGRRVKELQENIEVYLDQTVEYLENNMTRRSKRVINQLQKALNEGAEEVGEEPQIIGEDLFIGGYGRQIQLNDDGEITVLDLNNTKITSLDKVKLPDGLKKLHIRGTSLAKDPAKLQVLQDKYPNIGIYPQ